MIESSDRPSPVFIGFAESEPDLYEFRAASGQDIFLHDLACVAVDFQPLTRELTIAFDDPATDREPATCVVFTFADAEILRWEPNGEPVPSSIVSELPRVRGQVSLFDSPNSRSTPLGEKTRWSPRGGVHFDLSLLDLDITFLASTVTVTVTDTVWNHQFVR